MLRHSFCACVAAQMLMNYVACPENSHRYGHLVSFLEWDTMVCTISLARRLAVAMLIRFCPKKQLLGRTPQRHLHQPSVPCLWHSTRPFLFLSPLVKCQIFLRGNSTIDKIVLAPKKWRTASDACRKTHWFAKPKPLHHWSVSNIFLKLTWKSDHLPRSASKLKALGTFPNSWTTRRASHGAWTLAVMSSLAEFPRTLRFFP